MAAPVFTDGKDAGALRTIGEVVSATGLKAHVLRYWEQQFPMLQPLKRSGGRRYYRSEDVAVVMTIDRLVNQEGYTLRGARKAIESGDADAAPPAAEQNEVTAAPAPAATNPPVSHAADFVPQLRAIRNRLASALDN